MAFARLRRLRENQQIRDLVAETRLSVQDLILPFFVIEGRDKEEQIKFLPGIYRLSIDSLIKDIKEIKNLGIKAVLLFGLARKKDALGSYAYSESGVLQKAIRAVKKEIAGITVISDVCLCGYITYGHCGVVRGRKIDNDSTLELLVKIALSHAEAGADFVAPSAMMDGQVKTIRTVLDKNGFAETKILAYSAKYASNFYSPFREALNSTPQFGDRKSYQVDFRNADEGLREIEEDIKEGADIVMVKPALAYLDIIRRAKEKFSLPLAAYNVSGEYALAKLAAQQGLAEEKNIVLEIITAIKRAGADLIITYHAKEVAKWLKS